MKRLEFTIVPLLVMLSLSPAAGQSFSLPAASQAHPDVLGIKVGVSTVEDVRSVLTGTGLALWVQESTTWLSGALTTGFGRIQIPNSEHVALMTGISRTFRGPANERCGPITTTCQDLQARFSAPPNAGTVLALTRMIHFVDGPLTATVIKELTDRYGPPGFRNAYGDQGAEQHLVWAWAPDGSTVKLNDRHTCASQGVATGGWGRSDASKDVLQAGCAAMLFVIINQENSVTTAETIHLIDHYGIVAADIKTRDLVSTGVATYEQCERDRAAKRSVPSAFSNDPNSAQAPPATADSSASCTPTRAPAAQTGPCEGCGFITVNVTGAPATPNGRAAIGFMVWIDHVAVGRTPVTSYRVSAGRHMVRVIGGSNGTVNDAVQVDSGATVVKSYGGARP
jgi:PEGA domain-containing protein